MRLGPIDTGRRIWAILSPPERRRMNGLMVLTVIGTAFEMIGVSLVFPVIGLLLSPGTATGVGALDWLAAFGPDLPHATRVAAGMLGLVVAYATKNAFLAFVASRQSRFTNDVDVNLSARLFTAYLRQPYTFHLQRNSAHLVSAIVNEASIVALAALANFLLWLAESLVLVALLGVLAVVEPLGTLTVVILNGVVGGVFLITTKRRVDRWAVERLYHEEMGRQRAQEGLSAVKEVILTGRADDFLRSFESHSRLRARAGQRQDALQQYPRLLLEVVAVASLALLSLLLIQRGRSAAEILATLSLFAAAAFRVVPSLTRILMTSQAIRFAAPALERVETDLEIREEAARGPASVAALDREIALEDVWFTHEGSEHPALSDVSLRIRRGETIGLAGPSGSGKSTLIDILLGLIRPQRGRVTVDGRDIAIDPRPWQRLVGYVAQSIYLSDDTIKRNIAFGLADADIDESRVQRALRAARLEPLIAGLPQGVDTRVGEAGDRLSGGERQRIGIARALYHDPSVLIFDEATSALDPATERDVVDTIRSLHGDRTIVIVSHRPATLEPCDRVFRLKGGSLVADTTERGVSG